MKYFKIWAVLALLWAALAPPLYMLSNLRDEQSRKLYGTASYIHAQTRGVTNDMVTLPTEMIAEIATDIYARAGVEDQHAARFARAMWQSSLVIIITVGSALFSLRGIGQT